MKKLLGLKGEGAWFQRMSIRIVCRLKTVTGGKSMRSDEYALPEDAVTSEKEQKARVGRSAGMRMKTR